jgi:hypothetical protein
MLTFWNTNCRIGRGSEYVCCWYGVGLGGSAWQRAIDSGNGLFDICFLFSIRFGEIRLLFLHLLIVFLGFLVSVTFPINIAVIYFA